MKCGSGTPCILVGRSWGCKFCCCFSFVCRSLLLVIIQVVVGVQILAWFELVQLSRFSRCFLRELRFSLLWCFCGCFCSCSWCSCLLLSAAVWGCYHGILCVHLLLFLAAVSVDFRCWFLLVPAAVLPGSHNFGLFLAVCFGPILFIWLGGVDIVSAFSLGSIFLILVSSFFFLNIYFLCRLKKKKLTMKEKKYLNGLTRVMWVFILQFKII